MVEVHAASASLRKVPRAYTLTTPSPVKGTSMLRIVGLMLAALPFVSCSPAEPQAPAVPLPHEASDESGRDHAAVVDRDTQAIQAAIVLYFVENTDYPENLEELLPHDDLTLTGGLLERLPVDPWGEAYVYHLIENSCTILSKGPDRREGTEDDIVNRWSEYTSRHQTSEPR